MAFLLCLNLRILPHSCMFKYWNFRSSFIFWQFLPQPGQGSSCFFPMEVKQTQNLAERRDQLPVFCGQTQPEGTTRRRSRQRKCMKILHRPSSGCAACAVPVAPVLFCQHLKILNFLLKPRTVSEVHWDKQACAWTEETGAIWASATPCHPLRRWCSETPWALKSGGSATCESSSPVKT